MTNLVRTIRLRDLLYLFIGSVIGSGIFIAPGLILRQVHGSVGLSLLVWMVGGGLSLLGALTYAELAAANPEAGGLYCYIRDGFGKLPAFLYGWCLFVVIASGTIAALARAFTKAFLVGSLFLIGLYLVAVLAYLVALGPAAASMTDAIAATAAKAVLGEWAGKLVAATILISVFSSTNSVILTAPRVFYAMAKDNLFFKKLAEVHPRFQTPAASVISLGVLAAILTQAGKFSELVEGVIFVGWIFYGLAGAAIFPLRRKLAGKTLPYPVPGYPWTPILVVLSAIAIVGNAIYRATIDPAQFLHVLAALAFLAAGIPVYLFWRRKSGAKSAS